MLPPNIILILSALFTSWLSSTTYRQHFIEVTTKSARTRVETRTGGKVAPCHTAYHVAHACSSCLRGLTALMEARVQYILDARISGILVLLHVNDSPEFAPLRLPKVECTILSWRRVLLTASGEAPRQLDILRIPLIITNLSCKSLVAFRIDRHLVNLVPAVAW